MMEWVEYMTCDADSPHGQPAPRRTAATKPWKLPYFGVGNESWGCGGNMRPEYYADDYRRYNTFVKNYSGNRIERIACGSNGDDFNWTEVLMSEAGAQMNGLSLHYYTLPTGNWQKQGLGHRVRRRRVALDAACRRCAWKSSSRSTPRSWTSTIRRSASA